MNQERNSPRFLICWQFPSLFSSSQCVILFSCLYRTLLNYSIKTSNRLISIRTGTVAAQNSCQTEDDPGSTNNYQASGRTKERTTVSWMKIDLWRHWFTSYPIRIGSTTYHPPPRRFMPWINALLLPIREWTVLLLQLHSGGGVSRSLARYLHFTPTTKCRHLLKSGTISILIDTIYSSRKYYATFQWERILCENLSNKKETIGFNNIIGHWWSCQWYNTNDPLLNWARVTFT